MATELSREGKIREARRLRAQNWTAREIGDFLGVSESTIRNWYLGGDCSECGEPIDGSSPRRASDLCQECRGRQNIERDRQIEERWEEGSPLWLIAEELGLRHGQVRGVVQRGIENGSLTRHKLGGDADERDARRRQIIAWRREGLNNGEIGARLGTTAASVSVMFGVCRNLGFEVPPSQGAGGPEPIATAEQLEQLWREDLTLEQIADFCGYSSGSTAMTRIAALRRQGYDFPSRPTGPRPQAVAA